MKKLLLAASLLVTAHSMMAQINQGQILAGGNAGFSSYKQGDNKVFSFNVSPNIGYFFINNFAGGLRLNFSRTKQKGAEDAYVNYGVAPFLRYYFLPAAQKLNVFADASYGFEKEKYGSGKENGNYYQIMAGPVLFLTPNTGLEFALYYNSMGGKLYENAAGDRGNTIGLNIGFQVHLGPCGKMKKK